MALISTGWAREALASNAGGAVVGLVFAPNTDEVLNEMNNLDADIKVAHKELFDIEPKTAEQTTFFLGPWLAYLRKWDQFNKRNRGFFARFMSTSGIFNTTLEFRAELLALRAKAKELGFQLQTVEPAKPKESVALIDKVTGSLTGAIKVAILAIVAIGAAIIIVMLVK